MLVPDSVLRPVYGHSAEAGVTSSLSYSSISAANPIFLIWRVSERASCVSAYSMGSSGNVSFVVNSRNWVAYLLVCRRRASNERFPTLIAIVPVSRFMWRCPRANSASTDRCRKLGSTYLAQRKRASTRSPSRTLDAVRVSAGAIPCIFLYLAAVSRCVFSATRRISQGQGKTCNPKSKTDQMI